VFERPKDKWLESARERITSYRVLVRKHEGKRPLGRYRRRWEDITKVDLQEIRWRRGVDLSATGQGQLTGCCEDGNEHSGSIKCGKFLEQLRNC
jgi:hypothetical protein